MTLTTRLSLFFLTMLGIVLVGFSTTVYCLASVHLHRQAEERLDAAMNTLIAAVEVGPDGVEWEPTERRLTIGPGRFGDQVAWLVSDESGRIVDQSNVVQAGQAAGQELLTEASVSFPDAQQTSKTMDWQGERWQLSQRWIGPSTFTGREGEEARRQPSDALSPARPAPGSPPQRSQEPTKYRWLSITAGLSLEPAQATLRQLAGVLVGLSLGLWLLALFLGRAVSRRALRPVSKMASSARAMDTNGLGQRLPLTSTGDELEDLARAFNELLDRLQESFERQRRFTGDASHQLRTPLTAILGQIEVALRGDRPPQEYQRVLTSVRRQALGLRHIVEALLFLARADAETQLPHLEGIHLTHWLTGQARKWSDHPRACDLRVEFPPDCSLWVEAQEPLLGQLVDVLVENAFKYSESGTPITLRLWTEESKVCLAVEDQGGGIAREDLPHVFEPFYRSLNARRNGIGGVGLGLAIAERIAAALGGSLSVRSEPGKGSCFMLRLPLAAMPTPAQDCSGVDSPPQPQDAASGCRR